MRRSNECPFDSISHHPWYHHRRGIAAHRECPMSPRPTQRSMCDTMPRVLRGRVKSSPGILPGRTNKVGPEHASSPPRLMMETAMDVLGLDLAKLTFDATLLTAAGAHHYHSFPNTPD